MNGAQPNGRLVSLVLRCAHCLRTYQDNLRETQNKSLNAQTWILSETRDKSSLIGVFAISLAAILVVPRVFWNSWKENQRLFLHHQLFALGCVVIVEIAGTRVVYHEAVASIENSAVEYFTSFALQLVSIWIFVYLFAASYWIVLHFTKYRIMFLRAESLSCYVFGTFLILLLAVKPTAQHFGAFICSDIENYMCHQYVTLVLLVVLAVGFSYFAFVLPLSILRARSSGILLWIFSIGVIPLSLCGLYIIVKLHSYVFPDTTFVIRFV